MLGHGPQAGDEALGDHVRAAAAHDQHDVAGLEQRQECVRRRFDRAGRDRRRSAPLDGPGQVRGRHERLVRITHGEDVGDRHALGRGQDVGKRFEQGGRPVEGQRLIDGPAPPARVLQADGFERRRDRRRMVAVVVDHDDPSHVTLQLEATADAPEGGQAGQHGLGLQAVGSGRPSRPQRVVGGVAPHEGDLDRRTARLAGQAVEDEARPAAGRRGRVRVVCRQRRRRAGAGTDRPAQLGGQGRGIAARRGDGGRQDSAGPVSEPGQQRGNPGIGRVGDEDRIRPEASDPGLEDVDHRVAVTEHVGMVPIGVEQHRDRGLVRIEVAGVFIGLDDERVAEPTAASEPDDRWCVGTGKGRGQQRADEGRGVLAGLRQEVHQPAGRGRLAVGPGNRQERPAERGGDIGDQLLAARRRDSRGMSGVQLGLVGIDRGQGLADGDPVDQRTAARANDVADVVLPGNRDARRLDAKAVGGWLARVAARHARPGSLAEQERCRRGAARGADHVDPLTAHDPPGRAGWLEAPADLLDAAGHRPTDPAVAISSSIAAAALARLFAERSRDQLNRRTSWPPGPSTAM